MWITNCQEEEINTLSFKGFVVYFTCGKVYKVKKSKKKKKAWL